MPSCWVTSCFTWESWAGSIRMIVHLSAELESVMGSRGTSSKMVPLLTPYSARLLRREQRQLSLSTFLDKYAAAQAMLPAGCSRPPGPHIDHLACQQQLSASCSLVCISTSCRPVDRASAGTQRHWTQPCQRTTTASSACQPATPQLLPVQQQPAPVCREAMALLQALLHRLCCV